VSTTLVSTTLLSSIALVVAELVVAELVDSGVDLTVDGVVALDCVDRVVGAMEPTAAVPVTPAEQPVTPISTTRAMAHLKGTGMVFLPDCDNCP